MKQFNIFEFAKQHQDCPIRKSEYDVNGKKYIVHSHFVGSKDIDKAARVVRRIFEMRSQGISPRHIADKLNEEKVLTPSDYFYAKQGKTNPRRTTHLWCAERISTMLNNPTYLGHLAQMRTTTVSYKNHKTVKKDSSEWVVVENTHEPLVSQEIWDKCREIEKSVSQGKKTKKGETMPLSGLMFCADCGEKTPP